jgi:hypothetical protein
VCDDGLMPDIRTRVIDGFVRKMICCKGEWDGMRWLGWNEMVEMGLMRCGRCFFLMV